MFKIFIGDDSRFPEVAQVAAYSIKKHSSVELDINFLNLEKIRKELDYKPDLRRFSSTEFTYTRFLIPLLCNYKGKALFLDNDILCLSDIKELDKLAMFGRNVYAIRCIKHKDYVPKEKVKMYGIKQTSYPKKNWSSVMLLNCEYFKKGIWSKFVVENAPGSYLHQFKDIPNHRIGKIVPEWNSLDEYVEGKTKLIHYTSGGPWFKEYKNCPHADLWNQYYKEWKDQKSL